MQKRSYFIVLGVAAVIGVGISLPFQHAAKSGLGSHTSYQVAESDGYDDAYDSEPAPTEDSAPSSGTTDTGTSNDDYSSEDF